MFGTGLVGACAAGSLARDAYQAGRSYIALLCHDQLSEAVKRELIARLRHKTLPCPARGLELEVYTVATAQTWPFGRASDLLTDPVPKAGTAFT